MNKSIIKAVELLGRRLGYEIIPHWKLLELDLARYLRVFFEHYEIDTILDVGANTGGYYKFLRLEADYDGEIFSFEPVSSCIEVLQEQARHDPKWHIFGFALGNENEQRVINVMRSDDFSSFLKPRHDVVDDYVDYNVIDDQELVDVRTLDSIYAELCREYDLGDFYLKMDTQGFDREVFAGATNTLSHVIAMQSEVSVNPVYEGGVDYQRSINDYNCAGFELSGLFPVNRDKYLRVVELDCIMINSKFLRS